MVAYIVFTRERTCNQGLCVLKFKFCNIEGEGRRERVVM
jgi:hypothetical protein